MTVMVWQKLVYQIEMEDCQRETESTKAAYFSMIFYDTGIQLALKLTKQTSFYN